MGRPSKKPLIEVGKTYSNGRTGRIKRKVLGIGEEFRPRTYNGKEIKGEKNEWIPRGPGVLFEENGIMKRLMLDKFRQWMGAVVE